MSASPAAKSNLLDIADGMATKGGVSILPIKTDTTKAPAGEVLPHDEKGKAIWKPFQQHIADKATRERWFGNGNGRRFGIAAIGGEVSGGLEILDFDEIGLYESWAEIIRSQPGGQELLDGLVIVDTPSGGKHVYFRSDAAEGNQKLAERPKPENEHGNLN